MKFYSIYQWHNTIMHKQPQQDARLLSWPLRVQQSVANYVAVRLQLVFYKNIKESLLQRFYIMQFIQKWFPVTQTTKCSVGSALKIVEHLLCPLYTQYTLKCTCINLQIHDVPNMRPCQISGFNLLNKIANQSPVDFLSTTRWHRNRWIFPSDPCILLLLFFRISQEV